jgi:hypothetical protein
MIGTIRKHSSWLWLCIITLTIISFVWWGASPATRNGAGGAAEFGTIYGREVTRDDYLKARAEYSIWYWFRNHQWPSEDAKITQLDMNREIYWRILFARKAAELGIHVGVAETARMANSYLASLGRNHQAATMEELTSLLASKGYTVADLERTLADDIATEQLVQVKGLAGALLPPQEVSDNYDFFHQEYATEAVFFEASNYLGRVTVNPAAVGQFYTNYQAAYRQPDRIQINYVFFNVTNYLASSQAEWAKTNFEDVVTSYYAEHTEDFADEKTPEAAKAKIRTGLVRQRAMMKALQAARDFAGPVFNDGKAESLVNFAAKAGLKAYVTRPFAATESPVEFTASAQFVKEAFKLDADTPLGGPLAAADGFYVIGLAGRLPSAVPPFAEIRDRVAADYREQLAIQQAQSAGTNFYYQAMVQGAVGNTFGQVARAAGLTVATVPPFSLSTETFPDDAYASAVESIKEVAVSTPPGHIASFVPTQTGGFVLRVKAVVPADATLKAQELPEFAAQLRRERVSTAFNLWLQNESYREFRNIPLLQKEANQATR